MDNVNITIIQNNKCFIGTLDSILKDSEINRNEYYSLIEAFIKVTKGNATYINPNQIESYLYDYFTDFMIYEMKSIQEIQKYNFKEYTVLYWAGKNVINEDGVIETKNLHVTRFINYNNNSIKLMDPRYGELKDFDFLYLNELSPFGFCLVTFNRKNQK